MNEKPCRGRVSPAHGKLKFRFRWWSPVLLLFVFFVSSLFAANDVGLTGAEFLKVEVGARPAAMGGAYTAAGSDVYGVYYNPAIMGDLKKYEVGFQYNDWFQGVSQNYLVAAFPTRRFGTFGGSLNYVDLGELERTTVASGQAGVTLGTFSASDMALNFSWGIRLEHNVRIGSTLKWIHSAIESENANAVALDAGIKFSPYPIWNIAFSVHNLGTSIKYMSEGDPLPLSVRFGNSVRLCNDALTLSADLVKYRYTDLNISLGAEYDIYKTVALRVGYNSRNRDLDQGLTAGLGVHFGGFSLDYGYVPFGELGNSHRISMAFRFQTPTAEPVIPSWSRRDVTDEPVTVVKGQDPAEPVVIKPKDSTPASSQYVRTTPLEKVRIERFIGINLSANAVWLEKSAQDLLKARIQNKGIVVSDVSYSHAIRSSIGLVDGKLRIQSQVFDKKDNLLYTTRAEGESQKLLAIVDTLSQALNNYLLQQQ